MRLDVDRFEGRHLGISPTTAMHRTNALPELLEILTALLDDGGQSEYPSNGTRNPEEFDFPVCACRQRGDG